MRKLNNIIEKLEQLKKENLHFNKSGNTFFGNLTNAIIHIKNYNERITIDIEVNLEKTTAWNVKKIVEKLTKYNW